MDILKLALFLFAFAKYSETANILYIHPFTAKSHYIMLKPIGVELARKGHNVTVITGHKEPNAPPNYREVMIDEVEIWDVIGGKRPNVFEMAKLSTEGFHRDILWKGGIAFTEATLNSTQVKAFLAEDNKFDLVISEQFFQEATNLLAHKYNAPLVLVSTYGNCMRHNLLMRNPLQLTTVVHEFLTVRDPSSFLGRLRNVGFVVYEFIYWKYFYLEEQERIARQYLTNLPQPVPSLYEFQKKASLLLINGHFSFDPPTAYLPDIIEIGGAHLSKSEGELPEDLQTILDNAKHGVVYVNFGSNIRSTELPADKKDAFIKVFRKLKQIVVWKWEDDTMENKPENLILRKWMPQKEILAHPNIKVFISHGGLIGTQEAIFNGVPIIGTPIYSDQFNNLLQIQEHGFGKMIEFDDINEKTLYEALEEVLSNDSYMKNAKEISRRFKDRPMSPLDTAIFWIEYVIRNNGAEYLKNPAMKLSWVAYNMLDVHAFILSVLLAVVYMSYKVIKFSKSLVVSNKPNKKQKKKRN